METGIRQDLNDVFSGDRELVDDIPTLAMFPYLTTHPYDRVARWQRTVKTPSSRELTPTAITELHRMELFRLRAPRPGMDELCAIVSTSRSAYGEKHRGCALGA
jgi:hypothetical protein